MLLKNKGKPETTEETELLNKKSFGRSIKTMDRNTSAFWKEMKWKANIDYEAAQKIKNTRDYAEETDEW